MFKKIFLAVVIISALASIAAVLYLKLKPPGKSIVGQVKPQYSQTELDLQQKSKELVGKIKEMAVNDADLDGLSNEEEKKFGTNSDMADTDKDGLLDKIELELYKTNPLKADTDGDGFEDGYEVRRGFNPNGPGKLTK
ncbi:MAG: hypothetical protein AAB606_03910 [Patescibacteria group bacterium]